MPPVTVADLDALDAPETGDRPVTVQDLDALDPPKPSLISRAVGAVTAAARPFLATPAPSATPSVRSSAMVEAPPDLVPPVASQAAVRATPPAAPNASVVPPAVTQALEGRPLEERVAGPGPRIPSVAAVPTSVSGDPEDLRRQGSVAVPRRSAAETLTQARPLEALKAGANQSVEGLIYQAFRDNGIAPFDAEQDVNPTYADKAISTVVSMMSPATLVTFMVGGGMTAPVAKAGADSLIKRYGAPKVAQWFAGATRASGAFAGYDGVRDALEQAGGIQRGERESFDPSQTGKAMAKGAALGAAVGSAAAVVPTSLLKTGAEIGVFASFDPLLEGRAPTLDDVMDAGVAIGALKTAGALSARTKTALSKPRSARSVEEQATVKGIAPAARQALFSEAQSEVQRRLAAVGRTLDTADAGLTAMDQPARRLLADTVRERARLDEAAPTLEERAADAALKDARATPPDAAEAAPFARSSTTAPTAEPAPAFTVRDRRPPVAAEEVGTLREAPRTRADMEAARFPTAPEAVIRGREEPSRVEAPESLEAIQRRLDAVEAPARTEAPAAELPAGQAPVQRAAPPVKSEAPHDYSSTQVNLPVAVAERVQRAAAMIPEADLAGDGREPRPHVTVRYGLHTKNAAEAAPLLEGEGPITLKLGKLDVFTSSPEYDVVIAPVESPDLHRLNAKLKSLEHTDTHPEYKPHVTLAYVKKGAGAQYVGRADLEGQTVTVDRVVFSPKSGTPTEIATGTAAPTDVARRATPEPVAVNVPKEGATGPDPGLEAADPRVTEALGEIYRALVEATPGSKSMARETIQGKGRVETWTRTPSTYPPYMKELGVARTRQGADRAAAAIDNILAGKTDGALEQQILDYARKHWATFNQDPLAADRAEAEALPIEERAKRMAAFGGISVEEARAIIEKPKTPTAEAAPVFLDEVLAGDVPTGRPRTYLLEAMDALEEFVTAAPDVATAKRRALDLPEDATIESPGRHGPAIVLRKADLQRLLDENFEGVEPAPEGEARARGAADAPATDPISVARGGVDAARDAGAPGQAPRDAGPERPRGDEGPGPAPEGRAELDARELEPRYALREGADRGSHDLFRDIVRDAGGRPDPDLPERAVPGRPFDAGSGVRTVALGVARDLANLGRLDFRGRSAPTPAAVAALAQVYRDPRYETLRIFYTRGDEIVGHEAVTSRAPGAVTAFVDTTATRAFEEMRHRMQRLGADGYYMLHNHPSTDPTPSRADAFMSLRFAERAPGFRGHIIINHDRYAVLEPPARGATDISARIFPINTPPTEKYTPAVPHGILGRTIQTSTDVVAIGQDLQVRSGWVALLYRDGRGHVRMAQEMPRALFLRPTEAADFIRGQERLVGARNTIAYYPDIDPAIRGGGDRLVRDGVLTDAVVATEGSPAVGDVRLAQDRREERLGIRVEAPEREYDADRDALEAQRGGIRRLGDPDRPADEAALRRGPRVVPSEVPRAGAGRGEALPDREVRSPRADADLGRGEARLTRAELPGGQDRATLDAVTTAGGPGAHDPTPSQPPEPASGESFADLRTRLKATYPDLRFTITERTTDAYGRRILSLDDVVVPVEQRGQGRGSAFLEDLVQYADAHGYLVALNATAQYGTPITRLKAFYRKFGFTNNTDDAITANMVRAPRRAPDAEPASGVRRIDDATGLPLNPDGSVTLYHGTTGPGAAAIRTSGWLKAAAEPDVYLTTDPAGAGYGDGTVVRVRVDPKRLALDDEFPDGRRDYRLGAGTPGGRVRVTLDEGPARPESVGAPERAPAVPAGQAPTALARPEDVAAPGELFVQLGRQRYAVDSFADASERFTAARQLSERSGGPRGSEIPVPLLVNASGEVIGHISYNGRVWSGRPEDWTSDLTPLYDNRTAPPAEPPALPAGQAPRTERTALGDQVLIPDTPRREMPATRLRPEREQRDVEDTPLFGQGRTARREESERAQGGLFDNEGGYLRLRRQKVDLPPSDIDKMARQPVVSTFRQKLRGAKSRVIETQVNRFEPLRVLTEELAKAGAPPKPGEAPIETAELAKVRAAGQIEAFKLELQAVYKPIAKAGLADALTRYLDLKQFDKRIRQLQDRGLMEGETIVDANGRRPDGRFVNPQQYDGPKIAADMAALRAALTPEQMTRVEDAATRVWALNRGIFTAARDAGLVSRETYGRVVQAGEDYVPFEALDYVSDKGETKAAQQPHSVRYQDVLKRMEGTERDMRNPLEASLDKATRTIAVINRNRAAKAVTDLRSVLPGLIRELPGDVFKIPGDEVVISVFEDGTRKNYAVPKDIGRAMTFLDATQFGLVEKALSVPKTILQVGATGANVAFAIPNLARDEFRAAIYSKYGLKTPADIPGFIADWFRGLGHVVKSDEAYLRALKQGAMFTFQKALTPESFLKESAGLHAKSLAERANLFKHLLEGMKGLNGAIEQATKMQSVIRGERAGASPEEVAYETANYGGSPNFGRAGTWGQHVNLLWMFYNARLQGTSGNLRRIRETPETAGKAAIARIALFGLLPMTALWAYNQQFDGDYGMEEISDSDKQKYHVILWPETYQHSDGTTRRKYTKIAKEETNQILGGLLEAGLNYLKGDYPEAPSTILLDTLGNLSPVAVDVKDPSTEGVLTSVTAGALAAANPAIRLPIELPFNYNARTQGALVPRGLAEHVRPEDQARPTTSPTMKALSKALAPIIGVSPIKLEYAISSGTGGLGQSVLDQVDKLQGKALPETVGEYETLGRQPFLARVVGTSGDAQNKKTEERFYRMLDAAQRDKGSLSLAAKGKEGGRADELKSDPAIMIRARVADALVGMSKQLAEIRKAQVFVTHRSELSAEKKQAAMRLLAQKRALLFSRFRDLETRTENFTQAPAAAR
jgi:2'-5' RNA ligase/GNAT superfamily N-acetyltransferase